MGNEQVDETLGNEGSDDLRICAYSPEPLLPIYTKYGYKLKYIPKNRPLATLDTSVFLLDSFICAYAISNNITRGQAQILFCPHINL